MHLFYDNMKSTQEITFQCMRACAVENSLYTTSVVWWFVALVVGLVAQLSWHNVSNLDIILMSTTEQLKLTLQGQKVNTDSMIFSECHSHNQKTIANMKLTVKNANCFLLFSSRFTHIFAYFYVDTHARANTHDRQRNANELKNDNRPHTAHATMGLHFMYYPPRAAGWKNAVVVSEHCLVCFILLTKQMKTKTIWDESIEWVRAVLPGVIRITLNQFS